MRSLTSIAVNTFSSQMNIIPIGLNATRAYSVILFVFLSKKSSSDVIISIISLDCHKETHILSRSNSATHKQTSKQTTIERA